MRILEQAEVQLDWSDLQRHVRHPWPEHKRSQGRHVTEILKAIALKTGRLKAEDQADEMPLVVAFGIAMEEWFSGLYPAMQWQPGEVERDGIAGSPDGVSVLDWSVPHTTLHHDVGSGAWEGREVVVPAHVEQLFVIEEFKATYKSRRTRPTINDEWLWLMQVMAYCNIHEMRPRHVRFHVLWTCGDYKMPIVPQYWRYLLEFGQKELDENWAMMLKYKDICR